MGLRKKFPFWIVGLIILFAVATVWLRLLIVKTSYEIDYTQKRIRNADQELEKLELKVAQLRSPKRLEVLGRSQFQLYPPRPDQLVRPGALPP